MESLAAVILIPIACLLASLLLPARVADSHPKMIRQLAACLVGVEFVLAVILASRYAAFGTTARSISFVDWLPEVGIGLDIYYDGATSLMLVLVSFVGLVVSRFSIRYLDGEAMQGRYFRRLSFTIGAVSLMVIAGNLLLFFVA
jgi:NAD(P)H-quinone oxidoreductase subunit 5